MNDTSASATSSGRVEYIPSHGHGRLTPWQPGQRGNPNGVSGRYAEVRKMCAEKSVEATDKLIKLINDGDSRVAFMACKEVLERGVGKARDHTNEGGQRVDLSALTDTDRTTLTLLLRKLFGGG